MGNVELRSLVFPFVTSLRNSNTMNCEEEVFKIGKQLEKIVGQEGAVRRTFVIIFAATGRPKYIFAIKR